MMSGGLPGTDGSTFIERLTPWRVVAAGALAVILVNITSSVMEDLARGGAGHWAEPLVVEFSSYALILALAPLVGRAIAIAPPRADELVQTIGVHLGFSVLFSLGHVLGMVAIRTAAFWAAGHQYGFFDDGIFMPLLYEWRKDLLAYAAIAGVYWYFQQRAERPPPARPQDPRVELRDGKAVTFMAPADIFWVEAAGNYINFHCASQSRLIRGTISAWEERLAPLGFVRIHRSRLVNRALISTIRPTPSGDYEVALTNGDVLIGSRRYRLE